MGGSMGRFDSICHGSTTIGRMQMNFHSNIGLYIYLFVQVEIMKPPRWTHNRGLFDTSRMDFVHRAKKRDPPPPLYDDESPPGKPIEGKKKQTM